MIQFQSHLVQTERLSLGEVRQAAKLWDVETGKGLRTLTGHSKSVRSVAFHSPDGRVLCSGGSSKTIKLWIAENAEESGALSSHSSSVRVIIVHPDGGRLSAGEGVDKTSRCGMWRAAKEYRHSQATLVMSLH